MVCCSLAPFTAAEPRSARTSSSLTSFTTSFLPVHPGQQETGPVLQPDRSHSFTSKKRKRKKETDSFDFVNDVMAAKGAA